MAAALLIATAVLAPRVGRLALADVVLGVATLFWWHRMRRPPLPRSLVIAAVLWVVVGAASASLALASYIPERPLALVLCVGRSSEVVLALALGAVAAHSGGRALLIDALLVSSTIAAMYGIANAIVPVWVPSAAGSEAMVRSFERGLYHGEAGHFGGLFAVVLPVALATAFGHGPGPRRRAGVVCLVVCSAALLTTGSRIAMVASLVGMLLTAALISWRAVATMTAMVAVAAIASPALLVNRVMVMVRTASGSHAGSTALTGRAYNWAMTVDELARHPWFGLGPGTRHLTWYDSEILLALDGGGFIGLFALVLLFATLWLAVRDRAHAGESGALVAMCVLSIALLSMHIGRIVLAFAVTAGAAAADPSEQEVVNAPSVRAGGLG